jgi:hypothetical protein
MSTLNTDYLKVSNDDIPYTYYKNGDAKDPRGPVLLPAGKPITVTLETQQGQSRWRPRHSI